jgi:hypothetical protein
VPTIDLSERRKLKEPWVVSDGNGHSFTLPTFLSPLVMERLTKLGEEPAGARDYENAIRELYAVLFGEENLEAALAAVGIDEVNAIVTEAFGVAPGESPASSES